MEKLLFVVFVLLTAGVNGQTVSPLKSVTAVVSVPKQPMPEMGEKATYSPGSYAEKKQIELPENDTTITVYYKNNSTNKRIEPAYFVNGKHISSLSLSTIDPSKIEAINVEESGKKLLIDDRTYEGKVLITLKKSYIPAFLSLSELLHKHSTVATKKRIVLIDNTLVMGEYNSVILDEKFVQRITVEPLDNKLEGIDVDVVRILLRTEKNKVESKRIFIRGVAQSTN